MYPSIEATVGDIFKAEWNIAPGLVVPKTEDIALKTAVGSLTRLTHTQTSVNQPNLYNQTFTRKQLPK